MTPDIDLSKLSHAEKDTLIRSLPPLVGQLQAALACIAALEARLATLERPAKTPDNSSLPPSKGQKSDVPAGGKPPRKGRPGVAWALQLSVPVELWFSRIFRAAEWPFRGWMIT